MKSFHSLTSQFSCRCYFCEFLMFPLHGISICMCELWFCYFCVHILMCVHSCSCDKSFTVLHFSLYPPLSFVNYHVTPGNQTPPHHTHWHFVYHDLLPAVHDYVIILFFYVPCALYILTLCMCIVFEKFVFLTF